MDLRVIDSHTEGEPTRLVIEGVPEIPGDVHQRLETLSSDHDWIRTTLCLDPRGSQIAIGAITFPPSEPDCLADTVFFNNTGYLGMCGHGTIGILASLLWLGRVEPGVHRINTVAGVVTTKINDNHSVSFENVASYRLVKDQVVVVPGFGRVVGDIAYGGNWFFLVSEPMVPLGMVEIPMLMHFTTAIMDALWEQGITGENGARIDHIEVFGPSSRSDSDSKNFVLCPGKEYDRSPCGTGTSAKLACLHADGKLAKGQVWRQESIIGSLFTGFVTEREGKVYPSITGSAFVTADSRVLTAPDDPYRHGIVL